MFPPNGLGSARASSVTRKTNPSSFGACRALIQAGSFDQLLNDRDATSAALRAACECLQRCSAHAFGDPVEVRTFYEDLIGTGHEVGVSMPVMESYAEAVRQFAITV